jgi:apolipoprotein D and lipocalin family protein
MYRLIALAVLAGCVAKSPSPSAGFRDTSAQIYSNAVLENQRLAGRWVQVAEFANQGAADCRFGGADISDTGSGLAIAARLCLDGVSTAFSGPLALAGPGRFAPRTGAPWWVLWADVGYRTLVIGTPSGGFGFILNRGGDLPSDRLRAAREVLAWNGYDLSRLR